MSWIIKVDDEFTSVFSATDCWVEEIVDDCILLTNIKSRANKFEWLAAAELEANFIKLVWGSTVEIVEVAEEETK